MKARVGMKPHHVSCPETCSETCSPWKTWQDVWITPERRVRMTFSFWRQNGIIKSELWPFIYFMFPSLIFFFYAELY